MDTGQWYRFEKEQNDKLTKTNIQCRIQYSDTEALSIIDVNAFLAILAENTEHPSLVQDPVKQ